MSLVTLAMSRLQVLLSPDRESRVSEEQTLLTSDSWMPHSLSSMGLWNRQKNQGSDDEQEMVRLDPSGMISPGGGCVDTMDMALKGITRKEKKENRT
eukprot:TRINITY_DN15294_c0_g1_i1.p1 TRINITY_DN15294_c0_g1~~TRINITY_DN15294_c0_g1_i1.p1  ORF type:complete len:105 (+),score=30.31 TRINITY_DN15294_c0_g1_i1:26-316(+)